jgi:hypothetical protein
MTAKGDSMVARDVTLPAEYVARLLALDPDEDRDDREALRLVYELKGAVGYLVGDCSAFVASDFLVDYCARCDRHWRLHPPPPSCSNQGGES